MQTWPESVNVLVVGAGPAGIGAAYELSRNGVSCMVVEASGLVGGISRTEALEVDGYLCRCDVGGHRFYTDQEWVRQLWFEVLGDQFATRQRLSRIHYRGKFFTYPLNAGEVLSRIGLWDTLRILGSFVAARLSPVSPEDTFEAWAVNRFGRRLYEMFFRSYTEKVTGLPCTELSAEWAGHRIPSMSLAAVLRQALTRRSSARSLITEFHYPRLGVGQMWERMLGYARQQGCHVAMHTRATRVYHDGGRVQAVRCTGPDGEFLVRAEHVLTSAPLPEIVASLDPPVPPSIQHAAQELGFRGLIEVVLAVAEPSPFPDQWIYVHTPHVRLGRVQNYKNWSPDMVPHPHITLLGMEYFAWPEEEFWARDDQGLIALASAEGEEIGLFSASNVVTGMVIRVPHAYPVYRQGYKVHARDVRASLDKIENLQPIGRAGLFKYDSMDRAMMTGIYAARNCLGEQNPVWEISS